VRTGELADSLGISLRSLAPRLGISVASLFGYRSGKIPVSKKAWSKLERLEQETEAAGQRRGFAGYEGNLKDSHGNIDGNYWDHPCLLKDDVRVPPPLSNRDKEAKDHRIKLMEASIAGLTAQLEMMKEVLETLKRES
jgi:hypothetical protein